MDIANPQHVAITKEVATAKAAATTRAAVVVVAMMEVTVEVTMEDKVAKVDTIIRVMVAATISKPEVGTKTVVSVDQIKMLVGESKPLEETTGLIEMNI